MFTKSRPWYPISVLLILPDEKEKYDPVTFSDQIISGLNESQGDLEQVSSLGGSFKEYYVSYS